ncbi:ras GEF [Ramaria rubella]|nr:ras GEF [Ramaria rubella]
MATAVQLHFQNHSQNGMQDHSTMVDHTQYLSAVFCRALYDYQSRDASSLSFRKGDIIEVLTQLDSGWWDGLLHDERGWFPSNYVAPVSEREIEQELRASRMEPQSSDWLQDSHAEPAGPPNDFWVPQVTEDGRIFYVNTQTGERSSELPTEVDSDIEPLVTTNTSSTTLVSTTYSSTSSTTTAVVKSPIAGFGIPKRSGTPEPWVKRLADDGMSYYYLNTIDASIRWTAPSPPPNSPPRDPFNFSGARDRADSSAGRDRISVYSDDSDVNPLGILGRAAADASNVSATTPTPGQRQDATSEIRAARELQASLGLEFSPIPDSLDDLAQAARAAVTDLLDVALDRGNSILIADAVKRTTDTIRNLVYASSALIGPLTSLPPPYTADVVASDVAELKNFHRKVTATMIKFVSAIRTSEPDAMSDDAPARYENDAADLERAITAFVDEVLRRRAPKQSTRHVRAVLRSADGHKGVGLDLLGAGAAGIWKGFGFVQPMKGTVLGTELLVAVNQHKNRVDDALLRLESVLSAGQDPAVILNGQEVIEQVVLFLGLISDINLARALDFDSKSSDTFYRQSVSRANELLRALEFSVQAAFEDGAALLNFIQSAGTVDANDNRLFDFLAPNIPALRSNLNDVCGTVAALMDLARSQTDASANNGQIESIGLRDAALYSSVQISTNSSPTLHVLPNGVEHDAVHTRNGSEEDMVDFGDVLGAQPTRGERERDVNANIYGVPERERSDTSVNNSREGGGGVRDPGDDSDLQNKKSPTTTGSVGLSPNETTEDEELIDEEDFVLGASAKSPERGHKIKAILGHDAPDAYIRNASADAKPWYLRAEHSAKDIWINPEGGVRGGTLPALIERLTMHDNRDYVFNNTFLVTFRSFTTLDEMFDSLVKRFYIQPPPNLNPDELKEWTEQKQQVVRFRVINVLRQIVTDEDVLEKEDMHILERIKGFAATVDKEVVPPIPAAKQLLVLVDRAQSGGDAMIKRVPAPPSYPPAPIIPKINRPMKLLDIEPLELARQLTIMESKLFAKIRPMECLNRGRDGRPGDSDDNISAIIDTSNKVAEWVADAVLSKDDSRKRAAIVKQFIAVADRCRLLQNFSTMAAIVAGLNSTPIRRLKRTWEQVNQRSKAQLQEAERTMDTNKNFTNYRAILKGAMLPCVPFFGVYLSVLTFIQDGNKNMIQGDIINFGKREKFAEVIREIKHYQSKPYNLAIVVSIQNFIDESLSALGNTADVSDRAWNLSLAREPREREDEKMARLLQESGFL